MQVSLRKTQIVSYITYILIFVWLLLAGYLYYQYLIGETEQAPTKGGTLIEGVTSNITYLPKVKGFDDRFYKNLLFRGCLSYTQSGTQAVYESDLCDVITNDNKVFLVQLATGDNTWSDGAPVSIDDIIFTYEEIMQKNIWDLPQYKNNANIVIQKSSADSLTISFPQSSQENMHFFTDMILPAHIVKGWTWDEYTTNFPKNLVTNTCATLTNSRDEKSLIFDLTNCPDTRIKYYQVKNYTLDNLEKDPGIADFYIGNGVLPGYNSGNVITNNYLGLFFNMQLGKVDIYGRKNIIALVNKYIYTPENAAPIIKEHFLFDGFPTAVTDKTTISKIGAEGILTGVEMLPKNLTISSDNQTASYMLAQFVEPLSVKIQQPSDGKKAVKVKTNYGVQIEIDTHLISDPTIRLVNEDNIFPGYNELVFVDENDQPMYTLEIYYKTDKQVAKNKLIHVVYNTQDSFHSHIISILRNIFSHEQLQDYFFFDGKDGQDLYKEKIASKEYDITLETLSLGVKKDISPLLLTENPEINPSMYVNANLANQVKDFFQADTQSQYSIAPLITKLYSTDLPFFIIGKQIDKLYLKPGIDLSTTTRFDELTVRNTILDSVVLITKPQVTKQDILNVKGFFHFLWKNK